MVDTMRSEDFKSDMGMLFAPVASKPSARFNSRDPTQAHNYETVQVQKEEVEDDDSTAYDFEWQRAGEGLPPSRKR